MPERVVYIVLCGAVAVLFVAVALNDGARVRRLRRDGIRTRGTVVDNVRDRSPGSPWVPIIAFVDHQGHRVTFSPKLRGLGMGLATGREVPVVYLAHDPRVVRVHLPRHMVAPGVFLLFIAAVFLLAAALIGLTDGCTGSCNG